MQHEFVVDKLVEIITCMEPIKYWRHPLPGEWDSKLFDAALELYKSNDEGRDLFTQLLDEKSSHTLAIFAERMVSLALTQQSPTCLIIGLFVVSLTFETRDAAESFKVIALSYDAARRLDMDADSLLAKICARAPLAALAWFEKFKTLSGEDRSVECFGFSYDALQGSGLIYRRIKARQSTATELMTDETELRM